MPHDVFISHSSKDKTIADAACACLESRGIRCWIAPRDIIAGADWGGSIIDGINGAKLMVLILSSHSNVSKQVLREIERATSRGIPVVPLRVEDVVLSKSLEYFLSSAHWLDAYRGPLKHHLEKLANNAGVLLEKQDAVRPLSDSPTGVARLVPRSALLSALAIVVLALGAGLGISWFAFRKPADTEPNQEQRVASATAAPEKSFYLGIVVEDLLPAVAEKMGASNALTYVRAVRPDQKSGVLAGDIIVRFGDKPVGRSQDLVDAISTVTVAQPYPLTVVRGGTTHEIQFNLMRTPWATADANQAKLFGERRRFNPPNDGRLMSRLAVAGSTLIGIDVDNAAYAWTNLESEAAPVRLGPRTYSAVAVDAAGKVVTLADAKTGEIVRWDTATSSIGDVLEGSPNSEVIDLLMTDDGQQVIFVDKDANVRSWNLGTRKPGDPFSLKEGSSGHDIFFLGLYPGDFSLSGNGRHLGQKTATTFVVWDLEKKCPARVIPSETRITAGILSPDASLVAIALENGTIEVWDVATERKRGSLRWHSGEVCRLTFLSPEFLVSACDEAVDASVIVWNLQDQSIAWGYKVKESIGPFIRGPRLTAALCSMNSIFVAVSSIWQLALPPDVQAFIANSSWRSDELNAVKSSVPSARVQSSSSITATFGDGRTREIIDLEGGSTMATERDASGNLIGMVFSPGPGLVGLGVRLGGKDGSGLESHMPLEGGAAVLEVVAGGQAARDGVLQTGDVITAVARGEGSEPVMVDGLRLAELQQLIMGSEGTTVSLQVLRADRSTPIEVIAKRGRSQAVRRKAVRSDFTNSIGMEFVCMPAGIGFLGIDGGDADMKRHYVRMSRGYLIGAHEVTQSEFATVMKAQPSAFALGGKKAELVQDAAADGVIPHADTSHHPVENVSWEEAVEFCKRLSEKEGRKYRLPTEAEWEWSCRNGGKTEWKNGSLQGDWIDETSVGTHVDFPKTTHPVGSRSPNDAGMYDLFGNVAEWCADNFTDSGFSLAKYVDPTGPRESLKRVVRGGAFTDFGFKFFTRSGLAPAEKRPYVGFRVVLEAQPGIVDDLDRSRTLLETDTFTFDETWIPDSLPPVAPPLRSEQEEAKELQEIEAALSGKQELQALRTRLKTSGFLNQARFDNLRGSWVEVNTLLGNSQAGDALRLYSAAHAALDSGDSGGIGLYEQAAAKDSLLGWIANNTAWNLATNANPDHRDPQLAIVRAIDACKQTQWQYWGFLDTLAASLAADRRYEAAVRVAEAALERAPVAEKAQLEHAIEQYRKGQSWSPLQP